MAGLLWYRSYMDSLANTSGYYPDIHAGQADFAIEITRKAPYLVRETPAGYNQLELSSIIGGSVVRNQLVTSYMTTSYSGIYRDAVSADLADGLRVHGTAGTTTNYTLVSGMSNFVSGHKYLFTLGNVTLPAGAKINGLAQNPDKATSTIYNYSYIQALGLIITIGTVIDVIMYPQVIDLTLMLGPAIADYVYALEQATTGDGVAWLKQYDLIDDQYHAYSAPTLQSVEATSHLTKDENANVISTTTFGSVTLRGMTELVNGALKYNGDTYEPDGTVTRYYGERAYQAGDESLTDAITDGTDTVYKLGAPTTESANPYTAVQDIEEGGTEEFVTSNNIPVGNVSIYRRV